MKTNPCEGFNLPRVSSPTMLDFTRVIARPEGPKQSPRGQTRREHCTAHLHLQRRCKCVLLWREKMRLAMTAG